MTCLNCGFHAIPKNAQTCPNCGETLSPAARQETILDVAQNVESVSGGAVIGALIEEVVGPVTVRTTDRETARERRNKALLRERVQRDWVEGVLERIEAVHAHVTQGAPLIHLHKQEMPDAVDFDSAAAAELSYLAEDSSIPPERHVVNLFSECGRSLLILGEPGAGKTVALLQLARALLARAARDEDAPVPVVLNLASWGSQSGTLEEWIIFELNTTKYGVPRDSGRRWLQENHLVLLLDGLDEVTRSRRAACIEAINYFLDNHGLTGIVICCRSVEYNRLPRRIRLRRAILLRRLTAEQVDAYFDAAGPALATLRAALAADASLRELVENPLMLAIMSATYSEVSAGALAAAADDTVVLRRRRLFADYVQRMFRRKTDQDKPYSDGQTTAWLAWLARQLQAHGRATFLIEELQPSWLPPGRWQWLYMVASRTLLGLLGGLVGGLVIGLGLVTTQGLSLALQRGLIEGLAGGLIAGPVVGLFDMIWITYLDEYPFIKRLSPLPRSALKILLVTLIISVLVAAAFALTLGGIRWLGWPRAAWLLEGSSVGLVFGLSASLIFAFGPQGIRDDLANDIQTVERLSWSSRAALPGALLGAAVGALAGALAAVIARSTRLVAPLVERGLPPAGIALTLALIGAVVVGLAAAVFAGLTGTFIKIQKVTPNQGLRLSLLNAGVTAPLIGLGFAVVGMTVGWLVGDADDAITYAIYGLFFGVLAGLWYGGLFLMQHSVLRLLLWLRRATPPPGRLAHFLDYAAQRIFLQKVGGGYIFIHRYLQEHFAGLDVLSIEDSS